MIKRESSGLSIQQKELAQKENSLSKSPLLLFLGVLPWQANFSPIINHHVCKSIRATIDPGEKVHNALPVFLGTKNCQ
jgi:hypothetical protein